MKPLLNIAYATQSPSQKLDLYLPDDSQGKTFPLVFFIHGGGFSGGDKAKGTALDLANANSQNLVFASINYRLSGEAPFPAGIEDCKAALAFLQKNCKKYCINPTRVALMGVSSGGNYALMLGLCPTLMQTLEKKCVVCLYPVVDLLFLKNFAKTLKESDPNKKYMQANAESYFGAKLGSIPASKFKAASPLFQPLNCLPPTLLQHGTADDIAPIAATENFAKKAAAASRPVTLEIFEGTTHSDPAFKTPANLSHLFAFITKSLS